MTSSVIDFIERHQAANRGGRTVIPSMSLTSGDRIPVVGLGLWKVSREETAGLVQAAIRAGYRHLDCACDYGNEAEVGQGIRAALAAGACRRDELWITSKLW